MNQTGQALVTLLIFVATATIITAGAVAVSVVNSQATSKYSLGEYALKIAEAGAEEAVLKVLREPSYTAVNQSVTVGNYTAVVSVSGSDPKIITSEGVVGDFRRKIRIEASNSSTLVITSFKEQ